MPTSGDLKSGDPGSNYPTTPQGKGDETSSLIKSTSIPPNRLRAFNVHLKLTLVKKEEDSKVFPGLPKLNQSWTEVFEDFPMLVQRIRKVSKVHQSILKTTRFLIYWLTKIQSDSLFIWQWKWETHLLSFLQHMVLWLKDCLT